MLPLSRLLSFVLILLSHCLLRIDSLVGVIAPRTGRFPLSPSRQYQHERFWNRPWFHQNDRSPIAATSSSSAGSTRPPMPTTNTNPDKNEVVVVYQKVVRVTHWPDDTYFLGDLIEYLQDVFVLPERLPMVYARDPIAYSSNKGRSGEETAAAVVQWNSPLSPNKVATALHVQVVAIFTQTTGSNDTGTSINNSVGDTEVSMAMVVVEKSRTSTARASIPQMMQNLFADSEKRILKALDRGLDEFMASETLKTSKQRRAVSNQEGQDAILAEVLDDVANVRGSTTKQPIAHFVDAEFDQEVNNATISPSLRFQSQSIPLDVTKSSRDDMDKNSTSNNNQRQRDAAWRSMMTRAYPESTITSATKTSNPFNDDSASSNIASGGLDFAIQAAKLAQAKMRQKQQSPATNDFAILAAKEAAQKRPKNTSNVNMKGPKRTNTGGHNTMENSTVIDASALRPPMLDSMRGRAIMATISTPGDFFKAESKTNVTATATTENSETAIKKTEAASNISMAVNLTDEYGLLDVRATSKRINLNVRKNESIPNINVDVQARVDGYDNGIIRDAQDALDEMVEGSEDLSPEELLAEVMKFGNKQDREKTAGDGFVSGAFEKAKEILREQKATRDERHKRYADELPTSEKTTLNSMDTRVTSFKTLTPEEELRRMFEAGERIAESRMSSVTSNTFDSVSKASNEEIEAVINSDKTVSRYGRILDEELAELEVRINKSPGEDLDGPFKNPMFDIFSGPEVYDQNVNPLTAVNWPGALPGTKDVTLPQELEEAVKQAQFAVEVLMNMREERSLDGETVFVVGKRELSKQQVSNLHAVVEEAVEIGLIDDPVQIQEEASRLQILLDELSQQPVERMREIAAEYKDLLLSDHFVSLVKQRLSKMADRDLEALRRDDNTLESSHARERESLGRVVAYAQLLLKEVRALGAELESQQLEVIRSICKVAMDPSHQTEEQTALALSDAVQDMRPLFDEAFIAYLKYAIAEEEGRLARAGILDDPDHNRWLFVLKIVQQGVYAEISKGVNRYLEHIWYVLRMETSSERRMLLQKLIDAMPTLDVRPFVQVVENIVGALGDSVKGEFDGVMPLGEMTNKLLQLRRDMKEMLPPERIAEKSRDADEWAAARKKRLLEQRNLTRKRLQAAQATEHLDNEIEAIGRRSEAERFD